MRKEHAQKLLTIAKEVAEFATDEAYILEHPSLYEAAKGCFSDDCTTDSSEFEETKDDIIRRFRDNFEGSLFYPDEDDAIRVAKEYPELFSFYENSADYSCSGVLDTIKRIAEYVLRHVQEDEMAEELKGEIDHEFGLAVDFFRALEEKVAEAFDDCEIERDTEIDGESAESLAYQLAACLSVKDGHKQFAYIFGRANAQFLEKIELTAASEEANETKRRRI